LQPRLYAILEFSTLLNGFLAKKILRDINKSFR